eukprot:403374655
MKKQLNERVDKRTTLNVINQNNQQVATLISFPTEEALLDNSNNEIIFDNIQSLSEDAISDYNIQENQSQAQENYKQESSRNQNSQVSSETENSNIIQLDSDNSAAGIPDNFEHSLNSEQIKQKKKSPIQLSEQNQVEIQNPDFNESPVLGNQDNDIAEIVDAAPHSFHEINNNESLITKEQILENQIQQAILEQNENNMDSQNSKILKILMNSDQQKGESEYEKTIEKLRQQIMKEKQNYRERMKIQKQITVKKRENKQKQNKCKQKCQSILKIFEKQKNIEEDFQTDEDISSDDCEDNEIVFKQMNAKEKLNHVQFLWKDAWIKAKAGVNIIRFFEILSRRFYLFGVSKGVDQIEKDDIIPRYILMPENTFRIIWSVITIMLLIYTAIMMPFFLAFIDKENVDISALEGIVDGLFIIDILITFFSAIEMNIVDEDPFNQYLKSFYWSSQTVLTVGYGDMPAESIPEMILAMIWMMIGVSFYAFIIGNYSSMIEGKIENEATLQIRLKSLKQLALKANIPHELSVKLGVFVQNNFQSLFNRDDQAELFLMLPPALRNEILHSSYGKIIQKVKFFRDMEDSDFQWRLLALLRQTKLEKSDILYWRDDLAENIYFIQKGQIKLYTNQGYPYKTYTDGDLFGDNDTLLNLPRDSKAIAHTHVKLLVLKIDDKFETNCKNKERNIMEMIIIARKRRNHHLKLIKELSEKTINSKQSDQKSTQNYYEIKIHESMDVVSQLCPNSPKMKET